MLTGSVTTYRGDGQIHVGLSGDNDVSAEHARRLSASRAAKGLEVQWACTNGDPRDVRTFVAGVEQTSKVQR